MIKVLREKCYMCYILLIIVIVILGSVLYVQHRDYEETVAGYDGLMIFQLESQLAPFINTLETKHLSADEFDLEARGINNINIIIGKSPIIGFINSGLYDIINGLKFSKGEEYQKRLNDLKVFQREVKKITKESHGHSIYIYNYFKNEKNMEAFHKKCFNPLN